MTARRAHSLCDILRRDYLTQLSFLEATRDERRSDQLRFTQQSMKNVRVDQEIKRARLRATCASRTNCRHFDFHQKTGIGERRDLHRGAYR
jgi:hypothetical protein